MRILTDKLVTFIGGGHITGILLTNLLAGDVLHAGQVTVSSRGSGGLESLRDRFGVNTTHDNVSAARQADIIIVAVRPDVVPAIVTDLVKATLSPEQLIISLAAGTPFRRFDALAKAQPLVRAMPNPPSQIGQGVVAYCCADTVNQGQKELVLSLLSPLGEIMEVAESQMALITSLTSPVMTLYFLQSMIEAGIEGGLSPSVATQIAAQTIRGSLAAWQTGKQTPERLIEEASTPGGISVESMMSLRQSGFQKIVVAALTAGAERARQLSRQVNQ